MGAATPGYACLPAAASVTVVAHVHWTFVPPPGAEKTAGADVCTTWWNTGERPRNSDPDPEARCTGTIRELAANYRARALEPLRAQQPAAWHWLPTTDQIGSMSIDDLLLMKQRALQQIAAKEVR